MDLIQSDQYETPDDLFEALDQEFHFGLDAAAKWDNHKCERFFGHYYPDDPDAFVDALSVPWDTGHKGAVWLNPPYSRGNIDAFVEKAISEHFSNRLTIVLLTRCDPTTKWFKRLAQHSFEIRLLARRVKFKGEDHLYNFPCAVSILAPTNSLVMGVFRLWDWTMEEHERYYPDEEI